MMLPAVLNSQNIQSLQASPLELSPSTKLIHFPCRLSTDIVFIARPFVSMIHLLLTVGFLIAPPLQGVQLQNQHLLQRPPVRKPIYPLQNVHSAGPISFLLRQDSLSALFTILRMGWSRSLVQSYLRIHPMHLYTETLMVTAARWTHQSTPWIQIIGRRC